MKLEATLKIPSYCEQGFWSKIKIFEMYSSTFTLQDLRNEIKKSIPGMELFELNFLVDTSDFMDSGQFGGGNGKIRIEIQELPNRLCMASILQFGGAEITDEEAKKVFGKIFGLPFIGIADFKRDAKGNAVFQVSDFSVSEICLAGHQFDFLRFVKRNASSCEEEISLSVYIRYFRSSKKKALANKVVVSDGSGYSEMFDGEKGNYKCCIRVFELNGGEKGRRMAKIIAGLGSNYVFYYNLLKHSNGKWRRIKRPLLGKWL